MSAVWRAYENLEDFQDKGIAMHSAVVQEHNFVQPNLVKHLWTI